jgi:uncharacterized membrane protein
VINVNNIDISQIDPARAKRWGIIGGLALVVIVVGLLIYSAVALRVVSTDPQNGAQTDFLKAITIKFNHPLDAKTADRFKLSPAVDGTTSIQGDTLKFTPTAAYAIGTTYTATITSPTAKNGRTGGTVKLSFKPTYVEAPKFPQKLVDALPYSTEHFNITYTVNSDKSLNVFVELIAILNRPEQRPQYEADLKAYRQEALDYITQHGGDPAKLNILYSPNPDGDESDESHIVTPTPSPDAP